MTPQPRNTEEGRLDRARRQARVMSALESAQADTAAHKRAEQRERAEARAQAEQRMRQAQRKAQLAREAQEAQAAKRNKRLDRWLQPVEGFDVLSHPSQQVEMCENHVVRADIPEPSQRPIVLERIQDSRARALIREVMGHCDELPDPVAHSSRKGSRDGRPRPSSNAGSRADEFSSQVIRHSISSSAVRRNFAGFGEKLDALGERARDEESEISLDPSEAAGRLDDVSCSASSGPGLTTSSSLPVLRPRSNVRDEALRERRRRPALPPKRKPTQPKEPLSHTERRRAKPDQADSLRKLEDMIERAKASGLALGQVGQAQQVLKMMRKMRCGPSAQQKTGIDNATQRSPAKNAFACPPSVEIPDTLALMMQFHSATEEVHDKESETPVCAQGDQDPAVTRASEISPACEHRQERAGEVDEDSAEEECTPEDLHGIVGRRMPYVPEQAQGPEAENASKPSVCLSSNIDMPPHLRLCLMPDQEFE